MLRVKGVILSPTNDTLPYTSLVFETITGSTEVLPRTTGLIELGEDGSYDFPLLLGAYKVYANYANSMRMDLLGTCSVSQGMKPEMTLNELVSNYTYYPTTPDWVTDLDSKWQGYFQDLFNGLINDINSNVTNLNMAIVDGDARVVFDMTTYTNDVTGQLGATLIQQIKAGDSETLNQSIAYSDRWGNELATNVLAVSNSISTVRQELTAWKKESGDAYAGIIQRIELNEATLGSEIAAEINAQTGMMELRINEYMQYQDAELRSYMNATIDQITGDVLLQLGDQITTANAALKSEMELYVDAANSTQTANITNQINIGDAAVKSELKLYVDTENNTQTAAITDQISTANGAIQQQISVIQNSLATTQAAWQVVANVGQLTSAIGMVNDGITSKVYVQATQFVVSNSDMSVLSQPFVIENGEVRINNAYIGMLQNKTLIQREAGYLYVLGTGFGENNQFIEWYGVDVGDISNCSKANAITYRTNTGDAYFGGSLSAGILKNGAQNTTIGLFSVGSTALEVGSFSTNGKSKTVVVSYNSSAGYTQTVDPGNVTTPEVLQWKVQRFIAGSWQDVAGASGTFTGAVYKEVNDETWPVSYKVSYQCAGSTTFVDSNPSIANTSYRVYITGHSRPYTNTVAIRQTLSLVSVEQ